MTGSAGSAGSRGTSGAVRSVGSVAVLVAACVAAAAVTSAPTGAGPGAAAGGAAGPAAGVASRFAPVPGPYAVEAMNLDWLDQDRNRQVPARIYYPRREPGPFPVVLFSSGLGAGRNNLEFLGRHLASHGYVSVHVQHLGGDDQPAAGDGNARAARLRAARDPRAGLTRLLDLVFALDQVGALAASSPVLRGRIDLGAVAVGGNYLGAWTALAAAGLATVGKDGEESSLPDPRVKAALLLFPPPAVQGGRMRFEHVKVPCLHVVTVQAGGGENAPQAAARRVAFDRIAGADQVLVTAIAAAGAAGAPAGATSGAAVPDRTAGTASGPRRDPAMQDHVRSISTAFLDAYLRHDAAAKSWLAGGGLAAYLGDGFRVETRSR